MGTTVLRIRMIGGVVGREFEPPAYPIRLLVLHGLDIAKPIYFFHRYSIHDLLTV